MREVHPGDDSLIAYVLDEMEASERSRVESHLAECGACGKAVARLSAAIRSYRTSGESAAPTDILVDLLEAQAGARARPRARGFWRLPVVTAAVAVVLAVFFLTGFWTGRLTAPASVSFSPAADNGAAIHYPLPEPPHIPFQTAAAPESGSI